jgi:hypothetical protein
MPDWPNLRPDRLVFAEKQVTWRNFQPEFSNFTLTRTTEPVFLSRGSSTIGIMQTVLLQT